MIVIPIKFFMNRILSWVACARTANHYAVEKSVFVNVCMHVCRAVLTESSLGGVIIVKNLFYPLKDYGLSFEKRLLDFETRRSYLPNVVAMPIYSMFDILLCIRFIYYFMSKKSRQKRNQVTCMKIINSTLHFAKQVDLAIKRRFLSSSVLRIFNIIHKKWIMFLPGKLRYKVSRHSLLNIVWAFFLRNYTR